MFSIYFVIGYFLALSLSDCVCTQLVYVTKFWSEFHLILFVRQGTKQIWRTSTIPSVSSTLLRQPLEKSWKPKVRSYRTQRNTNTKTSSIPSGIGVRNVVLKMLSAEEDVDGVGQMYAGRSVVTRRIARIRYHFRIGTETQKITRTFAKTRRKETVQLSKKGKMETERLPAPKHVFRSVWRNPKTPIPWPKVRCCEGQFCVRASPYTLSVVWGS